MTNPTANPTSSTSTSLMLGSLASGPTEADIAVARRVSGLWVWVLAAGLLSIAVGIAVLTVRWDPERLALLVGVVFAVRGATDLLTSGSRPHRGLAIVSGVLGLGAAGIALAWPGPTLFVLATLVGVWLLTDGVLDAAGAVLLRGPLWALWLAAGVATAALGLWALAHPAATLAIVVAIIGVRAVLGGFVEVLASLELRRLPELLQADRDPARPPAPARSATPSPAAP